MKKLSATPSKPADHIPDIRKKVGKHKQKPKLKKDGTPSHQGEGGGQESTVTPEARSVLLAAFENGLGNEEACDQANVSLSAYKRYRQSDEKFRAEVAVAKRKLAIVAQAGMAKKIQKGDGPMIRWFLERKQPKKYGNKIGIGLDDTGGTQSFIIGTVKPQPFYDPKIANVKVQESTEGDEDDDD